MPKPLLQELIVTLFGLYAPEAGRLPVASLVALLGDLGVDGGAARSSVSRLKTKGILERTNGGGPAAYSLAPSALDVFRRADSRIFAPERSRPGDPWALVVFSVPEAERGRRYELRSALAGLGFGFMAAGVAIAPATVLDQALERLAELGLARYVESFTGHYGLERELRAKVGQWWDLDGLDAEYAEFIADYAGELEAWRARARERPRLGEAGPEGAGRDAFALYVPLLTRWRKFPYRDPNIPLDLLPVGWKAPRAKLLFLELHALLAEPAARHAETLLARAS